MQKAKSCKKPQVLPKRRVGIVRGPSPTTTVSVAPLSSLQKIPVPLTCVPTATPRSLSDLIPDLNLFLSPNFSLWLLERETQKKFKCLDFKGGGKNPYQKKKNFSANSVLCQPQRLESETEGFRETDTDPPRGWGWGRGWIGDYSQQPQTQYQASHVLSCTLFQISGWKTMGSAFERER